MKTKTDASSFKITNLSSKQDLNVYGGQGGDVLIAAGDTKVFLPAYDDLEILKEINGELLEALKYTLGLIQASNLSIGGAHLEPAKQVIKKAEGLNDEL